jgi:hypothetical protein
MAELKIGIQEGQASKTLLVIVNHFDVGIKKIANTIILNGHASVIDEIKAILVAKIIDPSKISSEWIYPLADREHPYTCSPDCKRSDTEAGCLGCPLA